MLLSEIKDLLTNKENRQKILYECIKLEFMDEVFSIIKTNTELSDDTIHKIISLIFNDEYISDVRDICFENIITSNTSNYIDGVIDIIHECKNDSKLLSNIKKYMKDI